MPVSDEAVLNEAGHAFLLTLHGRRNECLGGITPQLESRGLTLPSESRARAQRPLGLFLPEQRKFSPCTRVRVTVAETAFPQGPRHLVHDGVSGSPFVEWGFLKVEAGACCLRPVSPGVHLRRVTLRLLRSPCDAACLTWARGAAPAVSCVFSPRFAAAERPRDASRGWESKAVGRLLIPGSWIPAVVHLWEVRMS